jgi:hypothetical protein
MYKWWPSPERPPQLMEVAVDRNSSEYRTMPFACVRRMRARTMRPRLGWLLAALLTPCAMAQTPEQDRQREYYRELDRQREEQQRRAQEEMQRQQKAAEDASKRQQQSYDETTKNLEDHNRRRAQAAPAAPNGTDMRAERPKWLAMPPLPVERNVLLGSWRLEGGGQQSKVLEFGLTGKGATPGMGELMGFMKSIESGQLSCDMSFGRGITFTPTSFSSGGAAGMAGGPVAYRSRSKHVIAAIPGDSRANPMFFEIAGPNRIVWGGSCALVRVGAPAATAALGAAPGTRTAGMGNAGTVVDGAAFRCNDGSLLHVSLCQGPSADAMCKLTELHKPGLQIGTPTPRANIAARVKGCEAGGVRYGADDRPVFVR